MSGEGILGPKERAALLAIAREAIGATLQGRPLPPVDLPGLPPTLREKGASFVTLTEEAHLRGCIGSLQGVRPLALDVQANARHAAFSDPRFPPLAAEEWPSVEVEVSVLGPARVLPFHGITDLMARLRPGVDGVILEAGPYRATFLPQVWEDLPDPRQFLLHLAHKAGVEAAVYEDPNTRILTYGVESFHGPALDDVGT